METRVIYEQGVRHVSISNIDLESYPSRLLVPGIDLISIRYGRRVRYLSTSMVPVLRIKFSDFPVKATDADEEYGLPVLQ